jgi:hypothetical protein
LVHDRLPPDMTDATRRGWSGTISRLERTVHAGS